MAGQQDGYALGVDLGTSNTVAVLRWPDGRTRPLLVDGQPVLPSGVYADTDGRLHVGRDAQRLAQADPTRYEPNPKRRVDEPTVPLGDRSYAPAELLAATLWAIAEQAVATVGFLPPAVVTYPAAWQAPRRQVLHDALSLAGWPSAAEHTMSGPVPVGTRLLREPVAAARYYTEVLRRPVPVGESVAVFDFGGGTLDVAVVRNEGADPWGDSGFTVIATGGMADLGGLDLDEALLGRLGELVGGEQPALWGRLTRPETTGQWRDRQQLRDAVRGAKEMLSRVSVAPVAVPGLEATVPLTREDLERLATPLLTRAVARTREVIAEAGLTPDRLAGLFLVGGSSRVPLVARLLHTELGVAPTVLEQPELPVAEGALTDLPLPRRSRRPAPAGAAALAPPAGPPGTTPTGPDDGTPAAPGGTLPAGPSGTLPAAATGGTLLATPVAPTPVGVPGQGGHPAGTGWPGVPGTGSPTSPEAGGQPVGPVRRERRRWWIGLGAGLALAGVLGAAALWFTRDRYPALDFHILTEVARPAADGDRPTAMFTAVADDRAYLAYQLPDDRLTVVAVDAGTGKQAWRNTIAAGAQRWTGVRAVPGAVLAVADAAGDSTPRDVVVLDAGSGRERWRLPVHGDDAVHVTADTLVWVDGGGSRLVGLRLRDGRQQWEQPNPRSEYGDTRTTVLPVGTGAGAAGPAQFDGAPRTPWRGDADRLVQVGADRSVRVLDMNSGKVLRRRDGVADVTDRMVAHADRLYLVEEDRGYKLLGYDLGSLAEPTVLYSAGDQRRVTGLVACGEHRACLLEVPDGEAERTEVVAATEGKGSRRWPAAGGRDLVPVGEHLLVRRDSPKTTVSLFDPAGKTVLADRKGTAARVDAGNLLVFAETPSSFEDDRSIAGVSTAGDLTEMGQLQGVRSESCSWNTSTIVCGAERDFVLYRFAGDG
ncbi:Hsp70 family protein [Micromonospora rifamycinica]|uniref:PQQ-like domain-containing protein n=1 Tax=Micromonospora rifamycinica TaxID=291594 RepID=A0A109IIW0_9ACTN|nr:Hsp70 family protein [Micromonospora rifamycinica]KWV31351.1 heat-shock protein Hsp70 [Micromonospora rifamycinica]SCG80348.1 PQQ-like domain-containing protein [Micromonospora rifamycinica]